MKSLIVLVSYHHNNTQKVAEAMAKVLDAQVKTPTQTNLEELQKYDLIGFGSGIYGYQHDISLLDLADKLPEVTDKKAVHILNHWSTNSFWGFSSHESN